MLFIQPLYLGLGAFLIVATSVALWVVAFRRVAIPENRTAYVASWLLGGTLGVLSLAFNESGGWSAAPAWFAVSMAGLLLFTVSISRQKLGDSAIRVGDRIPAFTALDEFGKAFDSRDLAGQFTLIKFFRGHW